ncbi:MAG: DUF5716 family protein [Lachnospiraceae bacterium]|nr:DUF5716 family protein [Lachnospiraceae bacterium]
MESKSPLYIGIDLNDRFAMVSFYQLNMQEPETVSTVAGSENYTIPLVLAKRRGLGQWYYGEEAMKMAKTSEVICVDSLLRRAIDGEAIKIEDETFAAEDLLGLFIQKLVQLPQKLGNTVGCDRLVLTLERLSRENMDLFWRIAAKLGLERQQFMVVDHKESFYYFALNQKEDLWFHDVYLFECDNDSMFYYALKRNTRTVPQVVSITEGNRVLLSEDKDSSFLHIQQSAFENKIISSVYLVGDGFDGGWMKESLNFLCRGRRAFVGKNLYSKGACYAAVIREQEDRWPYIYMGENEMKFNICFKVHNRGELEFYTLISAGKNWFETKGECEVILAGNSQIEFWKQLPYSREAQIETLELTDLPKRPDCTTRLRITAQPIADDKVVIEIKDLGFGEIMKATEKVWKYTMSI